MATQNPDPKQPGSVGRQQGGSTSESTAGQEQKQEPGSTPRYDDRPEGQRDDLREPTSIPRYGDTEPGDPRRMDEQAEADNVESAADEDENVS